MDGSVFFDSLEGLAGALEVQGGLKGPERLRDDAGLYLYHEVADYLSRRQTYQVGDEVSVAATGAGSFQVNSPSSNGLRYGRYLVGMNVSTDNAANLTAWGVAIGNSGIQGGYPTISSPPVLWFGGTTVRLIVTAFNILVPDPQGTKLPLWLPPGSFLNLKVQVAGVSGNYSMRTIYHTSEAQNQLGTIAIGPPRAPVKV